ncbi:MAG: hypothetical protein EPN97_02350 [Alphaproteobacteria bacterium]|nr:MAG: hypothetical protein EPN97_02350 [Alphaproteobacteria bacterium]
MGAQQDRDERAERVHAFESAVMGNDVATARKLLESGFIYEKYSWPRTSYEHILKDVVYRGNAQMYSLLKQHGIDFRYLESDARYQLKLEVVDRDVKFSALQEELRETKAEVTALRDLVTGLSQKLEELDGPKLDKPRPSLKR